MKTRRKRILRNYQKATGCDTIVTFEPENLFYLTGFWGEAIGILDKNTNATIIAPELEVGRAKDCLLYTSPSPRDGLLSRMPSSA